jgi:hypothetical protein
VIVTASAFGLVNVIVGPVAFWHTVASPLMLAPAVGRTVIVNEVVGPSQAVPSLLCGVTVMVAVIGVVPLFVAVKDVMLPVPLAARPIDALSFVQVNDVALPVKSTSVVEPLLQTVWLPTASTLGVGFTVIVNVTDVPVQPFAFGVIVIGAEPVIGVNAGIEVTPI